MDTQHKWKVLSELEERVDGVEPISMELILQSKDILTKYGNGNCEVAHYIQDMIYVKFITHVANSSLNNKEIIEMAKELEIFRHINFSRWYA